VVTPSDFTASSKKRIAAFTFDFLVATLLFLCFVALFELQGTDVGSFRSFVICHAAYHIGCLTLRHGETFGKTAQYIRVVSVQGKEVTPFQAIARVAVRYVPLLAVTVPYVEWETLPALLGLSAKIVAGLLWLRELHLLQSSPARQTLADLAASTLVVSLPPPQPHRAPAAPMYSATDQEFGVPPKGPKNAA
jgi:uncharacterized RDD family membrane protein YckC